MRVQKEHLDKQGFHGPKNCLNVILLTSTNQKYKLIWFFDFEIFTSYRDEHYVSDGSKPNLWNLIISGAIEAGVIGPGAGDL